MPGIIPKPIKKTSKLYEFAPHIVFGLVAAAVLAYVILSYSQNQTSKKLENLEYRIAQVGTQDERSLETQLIFDKQRIDDFSKLLSDHKITSKFFAFLEENSHPKVWLTKVGVDSQNAQATLTGETLNFQTLGQQMLLFQSQDSVKSADISEFSLGKSGQVAFTISLNLDPKIFKNEPR